MSRSFKRRKAVELRAALFKMRSKIPKERPIVPAQPQARMSTSLAELLRYDPMTYCCRCKKFVKESLMFSEDVCNLCVTEKERKARHLELKRFKREIRDIERRRRKKKGK